MDTRCLLVFSLCFVSLTCPAPLPDPLTRANETLKGMFKYYWTQDPSHEDIEFFFACGQMGGWGPTAWNQCSCKNPGSCIDCYRWWDAVALESIANYGILAPGDSKEYGDVPDKIFSHSPYNAYWPSNDSTYIDDFAWYGIAYLKVYEWLKDVKWLNRSIALYDWAWANGWDHNSSCGGFLWSTYNNQHFKDSITFLEMMHTGSRLAYMFPKELRYVQSVEKIWDWIFSFDGGFGLFAANNLFSTGAVPAKCCNSSTDDPFRKCHNSKIPGTSYNQGLLLSSSAYLYRVTGDKKYLNVGLRLLEAIFANYTTKDGLLVDEPRSYQTYNNYLCQGTTSDPGGDWYSFQGVMMIHLSYFTELLAENKSLPVQTLQSIRKLTNATSDSAWTKSAVWPPFNKSDACNTNGLSPNSSYPKFHWWWGNDTKNQIIPSDPQLFFHKTTLRCFGNHSELWVGKVSSEDDCRAKCLDNSECSKYQYHEISLTTNCWLWPYSRTNHICNGTTISFNVGFKRPVGNATCAGHCGSEESLKTVHGACYCDKDCAKYHDCCLDYADICQPDEPISCKGLCNTVQSRPLIGGGYCWCFYGCNPWFTDNNSDGSCCQDYPEQCNSVTMPTCLDARTQGSALNLFIAHHIINKIE